jgi:hypothetical protein
MVGGGMALTGACPGTVFVQVATGVPSALPVLLGGLVGGIIYVLGTKVLGAECKVPQNEELTISSKLQISPLAAIMAYDGILGSVIVAASQIKPQSARLVNPILGGLAIGAAQLASVVLTQDPIGMSTSYEDAGKWLFWSVDAVRGRQTAKPGTKPVVFAGSVLLGAYLFGKTFPDMIVQESMPISASQGFVGGLIMILGARIANGCTSGHGITGMAVLSIASVYTVAAMFAGGIALALTLGI